MKIELLKGRTWFHSRLLPFNRLFLYKRDTEKYLEAVTRRKVKGISLYII